MSKTVESGETGPSTDGKVEVSDRSAIEQSRSELEESGVVVMENAGVDGVLTLNRQTLFLKGYDLVLDERTGRAVFVANKHAPYVKNQIEWLESYIHEESLFTYGQLKLQEDGCGSG